MSNSSYVIAISGPSGSGKTSLVKAVAEGLGDSAMLFFDDFPSDFPPGAEQWATEPDADFSRVSSPEFAEALAALGNGRSIVLPDLSDSVGRDRSREVSAARYTVIEEPYGRLRPETARSIDFVVFISTPLNVALARRLSRQIDWHERWAHAAADADERAERLQAGISALTSYLEPYAAWEHVVLGEEARQLSQSSDLTVDGLRSVEDLASAVVAAVRRVAQD